MREASSETLTMGFICSFGVCELVEGLSEITTFGGFHNILGFAPSTVFARRLKQNCHFWGFVPLGNYNILRGKTKNQKPVKVPEVM